MNLTLPLVILYVGMSIINGLLIANNEDYSTDENNNIKIEKSYFKPYTFSILSLLITILYIIQFNIIGSSIMLISFISDLRKKL